MPEIIFVQPNGETRAVQARSGYSLLEAELAAGIDGIEAVCGGSCMCATCIIHLPPEHASRVPAADAMERELLSLAMSEVTQYSRLSCQIEVTDALDGLVVHVSPEQG